VIERLHPATFALVMATGIVTIGCELLGLRPIAVALTILNIGFYLAIWALTAARFVSFRDKLVADLLDHGRSVGYFTVVAATCVLGSEFFVVLRLPRVSLVLWCIGVALDFMLTYAIFTILTVKQEKPKLEDGINGAWLTVVVAMQSVVVLGTQVAPQFVGYEAQIVFFCLFIWLSGCMLYIWIISLIFYRYTFFVLSPSHLAPPYWINMGAAAISTLAGTMLINAAPSAPVLQQVLPFVRGFTLFWWATATWWIPMLVILGVWRHLYRRFPLRYDTLYWGAVFPLGMYTVCTTRLARAIDAPYLMAIPRVFIWIALAAWTLAFVGLVSQLKFLKASKTAAA
jgi:tellurite resistance protein TehA-like permease